MADPIPPVQNQIRIHTPESDAPELANGPNGFDRKKFMGAWHVVWSTLPMWKTNKSVLITYTTHRETDEDMTVFNSSVTYTSRSGGKQKEVAGVERLAPGTNGATFDWTGNGWMRLLHSHWGVVGTGELNDVDWCVITFSKTMFTPAGLDLFLRPKNGGELTEGMRQAARDVIQPLIVQLPGEWGKIATGGFIVP